MWGEWRALVSPPKVRRQGWSVEEGYCMHASFCAAWDKGQRAWHAHTCTRQMPCGDGVLEGSGVGGNGYETAHDEREGRGVEWPSRRVCTWICCASSRVGAMTHARIATTVLRPPP